MTLCPICGFTIDGPLHPMSAICQKPLDTDSQTRYNGRMTNSVDEALTKADGYLAAKRAAWERLAKSAKAYKAFEAKTRQELSAEADQRGLPRGPERTRIIEAAWQAARKEYNAR